MEKLRNTVWYGFRVRKDSHYRILGRILKDERWDVVRKDIDGIFIPKYIHYITQRGQLVRTVVILDYMFAHMRKKSEAWRFLEMYDVDVIRFLCKRIKMSKESKQYVRLPNIVGDMDIHLMKRWLIDKYISKPEIELLCDDSVIAVSGPFIDFAGRITRINKIKKEATVEFGVVERVIRAAVPLQDLRRIDVKAFGGNMVAPKEGVSNGTRMVATKTKKKK